MTRASAAPRRVLIAGAGVAGLEALLALRALAGSRVDVTILSPELRFTNRSMAVDQPFKPPRVRGLRLEDVASQLDARWHRGALDRVQHGQRRVVTKDGEDLAYDFLVLAVGARFEREWTSPDVLTYRDGRDGAAYRELLRQLRDGRVNRVAFLRPAGATWPMPLYDLALMTAAECAAHDRNDVQLSLVTPEEQPLDLFGRRVGAEVRRLLRDRGVALHTSSYGVPSRRGWVDISPGERGLAVDRIVTVPRLIGPRLRGIPCVRDGFIHTDAHGRVAAMEGVFAAGDATGFPIKHGGLAAQQADTVAESLAAAVGAEIDPQPFRPVLRGLLLTGRSPRFLRADVSGGAGDDSVIAERALWWPPIKLYGRYLAPYLSGQVGSAADVMPSAVPSIQGARHDHH
jgi:sulfide:quinone oxidoreductase